MAHRGRGGFTVRPDKPDATVTAIVAKLRELGASVWYIQSPYGKRGLPDLLVGWMGTTYLLEAKSLHGRTRPEQEEFLRNWRGGPVAEVRDVISALIVLGIKESMAC